MNNVSIDNNFFSSQALTNTFHIKTKSTRCQHQMIGFCCRQAVTENRLLSDHIKIHFLEKNRNKGSMFKFFTKPTTPHRIRLRTHGLITYSQDRDFYCNKAILGRRRIFKITKQNYVLSLNIFLNLLLAAHSPMCSWISWTSSLFPDSDP